MNDQQKGTPWPATQPKLRSRWRSTIFGLVLILATGLGLHWHYSANSTALKRGLSGPDFLSLHVYESDVSIPITFNVVIEPDSDGRQSASVYVDSQAPTKILISANRPEEDGRFATITQDKLDSEDDPWIPLDDIYFDVLDTAWPSEFDPGRGDFVGSFALPESTIVEDHGNLQAKLPSIGSGEYAGFGVMYGLVGDGKTLTPNTFSAKVTQKDNVKVFDEYDPRDYTLGDSTKEVSSLFWAPKTLQTTERVTAVGNYLYDSDILVNQPSSGTVVNGDFVWSGSYGVDPVLSAVNRDAEEHRARDEFLSGVALATAAAAFVALVQEAPDRMIVGRKNPSHAWRNPTVNR